jgi:hypothetical protein
MGCFGAYQVPDHVSASRTKYAKPPSKPRPTRRCCWCALILVVLVRAGNRIPPAVSMPFYCAHAAINIDSPGFNNVHVTASTFTAPVVQQVDNAGGAAPSALDDKDSALVKAVSSADASVTVDDVTEVRCTVSSPVPLVRKARLCSNVCWIEAPPVL